MNDGPVLDAVKLQRVEEERQHLLEMSTTNAEHAASLESQLHTAEAQLSSTRQTLAESREVAERQLQAGQTALHDDLNCYCSASPLCSSWCCLHAGSQHDGWSLQSGNNDSTWPTAKRWLSISWRPAHTSFCDTVAGTMLVQSWTTLFTGMRHAWVSLLREVKLISGSSTAWNQRRCLCCCTACLGSGYICPQGG